MEKMIAVGSFLGTTTHDKNQMTMDSIYHNRKYSRVDWHTYNDGLFFVTISTLDKVHYFGAIENCQMNYSEIGQKMVSNILELQSHYSDVEIDEWVVMPNHVHLIVKIGSGVSIDGIVEPSKRTSLSSGSQRARLSSLIGGLKSGVKRYANQNGILFHWLPRFYEHIIRTPESYCNIKAYIQNNIAKWEGARK